MQTPLMVGTDPGLQAGVMVEIVKIRQTKRMSFMFLFKFRIINSISILIDLEY